MDFNLLSYLRDKKINNLWNLDEQERVKRLSSIYSVRGKHIYVYTADFGHRIIPTIAERETLV